MTHTDRHPLAGKFVTITSNLHTDGPGPHTFHVEDWWDRLTGKSWMVSDGNPAAMMYGIRSGFAGLPVDNEVVYGKVGPFGHLVHVSEIVEED